MLRRIFVLLAICSANTEAWTYTQKAGTLKEGSSCQTNSQEVGVCSFLQNCQPFVTKRISYTDLKRCTFVGRDELTCCPHMPVLSTMTPFTPTTENSIQDEKTEPRPGRRPAKIACDAFCEKNPDRITSRVFGQKRAATGEFPHIGAMIYYTYSTYNIGCEATLISERFALTAAVCVDQQMPSLVRFGLTEWNLKRKESYHVDARIKTVTKHSRYRAGLPLHDIAVIEFTEDVPLSPFVSPACLRTEQRDLPSSVPLQVAGWSKFNVDTKKRIRSNSLLSANMTTVQLSACTRDYKGYLELRKFLGHSNDGLYCAMDLAKNYNTDECYGEPGGPLMVDTEELWEIIGVTSYANPCGVRLPNVFTRVSYYLDWIEKIVWSPKSTLRRVPVKYKRA